MDPMIACCGVDCAACADYQSGVCPSCRLTDWGDDPCLPVGCCGEKGIDCCAFCEKRYGACGDAAMGREYLNQTVENLVFDSLI